MEHRNGRFAGSGGSDLFYQVWAPDGPPRAALAIVHGVGEHGGRYDTLVEHLVPRGMLLAAYDLRGHGRSPGRRGHVDAWARYREDTDAFQDVVAAEAASAPLFLYGHSLGSLIVLDYAGHHPGRELAGVIASGTAVDPTGVGSALKAAAARILSRIWPTLSLDLGLDAAQLSTDPAVVRAYETDPLVHGRVTARWGTETLAAVDRVKARAGELSRPVLLVHGGSDPLNSAEGARRYYEELGSTDRELIVYPGALHEPHNDHVRTRLAEDVERWTTERIP